MSVVVFVTVVHLVINVFCFFSKVPKVLLVVPSESTKVGLHLDSWDRVDSQDLWDIPVMQVLLGRRDLKARMSNIIIIHVYILWSE